MLTATKQLPTRRRGGARRSFAVNARALALPEFLATVAVIMIGLHSCGVHSGRWLTVAVEVAIGLGLGLLALLLVHRERRSSQAAKQFFTVAVEPFAADFNPNEARFLAEHIVEQSLVGMAFYRGDTGECVIANPAFCDIIGADIKGTRAQRFREIPSWQRSGLLQIAEQVLVSGIPARRPLHLVTSFGKELDLECLFSRVALGSAAHLLLVIEDVSERVRAETKLREEAEQTQRYLDTV